MSTVPTNPPANPLPGAIYVDLATNIGYVYTGSGWIPASGGSTSYRAQTTTGSTILPGFYAEPSPESFITQTGAQPVNPGDGQIWVDTTSTPSPAYVWYNDSWFKITDGEFTNTAVGATPTASPDLGDSFYETTTGNFYVWDGSSWKGVGIGTDTHTIYTNSAPQYRANGSALLNGDLWLDSSTGGLSYWNGSWVSISGGGGGSAVSATPTVEGILYGFTSPPNERDNVYLGENAGNTSVGPVGNVFIGKDTAFNANFAGGNVIIGCYAGDAIVNGSDNVSVGSYCFANSGDVSNCTAIGYKALRYTGNTNSCTVLGTYEGGPSDSDTLVLARSGVSSNILLKFNENNALGIADWDLADPDTWENINYGTSGQVLTSQGPGQPVIWSTVSSGGGGGSATEATPYVVGTVFGHTLADGNFNASFGRFSNNTGTSNVFLGHTAGGTAPWGSGNVFVGETAGSASRVVLATNLSSNVVIGKGAGSSSVDLNGDIIIGHEAGEQYASGVDGTAGNESGNIFIGVSSGSQTIGDRNIYIGYETGRSVQGAGNLFLGPVTISSAAFSSNNNLIIGYGQGGTSTLGFVKANSSGSWGLWDGTVDPNDTIFKDTHWDYGTAGQILQSNGNAAPPSWVAAPSGGGLTIYSNADPISIGNSTNGVPWADGIAFVTLLSPALANIYLQDPSGALSDGVYKMYTSKQAGSTITISGDSSSTAQFNGGGNSFSWTPTVIGETLKITYYSQYYTSGWGYLVEITRPV